MENKLTPTFADQIAANGGQLPPVVSYGGITAFPRPVSEPPPPVQQVKREKVALIGTAPSSRDLAPYDDLTWDIWVCSPGNMNMVKRVDAWFELHKNLLWPEYANYGKPYIEWLQKQGFPIYMQDKELVPNALVFPKAEMVKEFGRYFWSSSFVWMMALAITKGFKEIGLFGIDMASKDEYIQQRPGFYYFLEQAEKRGIKVWAPNESDIMVPPPLYAYSEVQKFGRKQSARYAELATRIAQIDKEIKEFEQQSSEKLRAMKDNRLYLAGALENTDYNRSIHGGIDTELD